ncbi:nitric oxide reductase activation protein NorD [Mycolicibacterium pyrenivorans]|uniref:nitric oxide reductase activation protein NorD n=1 Tax=Mycolicibacterium pyrenivorans TaxID=187102 RepID=UPI0035585455
MTDDEAGKRFQALGMFASALAGKAVAVMEGADGDGPWTDGEAIYINPSASAQFTLPAVAVQASLIAAGSLDPDVVRPIVRHPRLAKRYLAVEAHRALVLNAGLLPAAMLDLGNAEIAGRSDSATASLTLASTKAALADAPSIFGTIRAKKVLAASRDAVSKAGQEAVGHAPRKQKDGGADQLEDLNEDSVDESDDYDLFSSPVGGGTFIGRWLSKLLKSTRKSGDNSLGPPGADSATHQTNSAKRGRHAVASLASAAGEDVNDFEPTEFTYPEWDAGKNVYKPDWCTVHEVEPRIKPFATQAVEGAITVRKPLARLGMGLHRRRRQAQGDDIDIDAAIEARVELMAGSVPDESVYIDTLRRRRDLSVLLLLDVSGSTAEAGTMGRTVHQQQREAVAHLMIALHDLGDRASLYAYCSQGRTAVTMTPIKRFNDHLDAQVFRKLNSLEPGSYSRLGAAIRHGSTVLEARGGTSRRLLVVVSDGLAYDHGYDRRSGAADARRALIEARRRGTGCVCLTIGADTDTASLRRVFGSAAHMTIARPDQLGGAIGPLFRSAVRSAEVRRRVS